MQHEMITAKAMAITTADHNSDFDNYVYSLLVC